MNEVHGSEGQTGPTEPSRDFTLEPKENGEGDARSTTVLGQRAAQSPCVPYKIFLGHTPLLVSPALCGALQLGGLGTHRQYKPKREWRQGSDARLTLAAAPQLAPPPSSTSSGADLAAGIGIGPRRVPRVKGANRVWAGFLVKAVASPQAYPCCC